MVGEEQEEQEETETDREKKKKKNQPFHTGRNPPYSLHSDQKTV